MSEPSFWPDAPGARVMMRMGAIGADGDDPGSEPDWHTLEGARVHLAPGIDVVTFEGIVAPLMDVDCVIDADGYLKTVEGMLPIFVLATDDDRLSVTGWLWSAQLLDRNITIRFPAPSDGVVNLADYLTAPPSDLTMGWVERIPELIELIDGAERTSIDAAERAEAARDEIFTSPYRWWVGTQAEYDALPMIDPTILYLITTVPTRATVVWSGTQAEYDALTPVPSTLYVIQEA